MSVSEAAVKNLRQTLAELIPTLLNGLASLHQQHPTHLSTDHIFAFLRPLVASPDVKQGLRGGPPTSESGLTSENDTLLRSLCFEVSKNELRKVVSKAAFQVDPATEVLSEAVLNDIFDRLDVTLSLAMEKLVEDTLPLTLLEDLIEVNTLASASRLFGYIESRVKQLTIGIEPSNGKGLFLKRTCNELLRRLSKPSQAHTVFAGRILCLLAAVFGVSERGGVNFHGHFNVENTATIEQPDEADEEQGSFAAHSDGNDKDAVFRVEYSFYELFWKVQRFFSNPQLLTDEVREAPPVENTSPVIDERNEGDAQPTETNAAPEGSEGPMAELRTSTTKILDLFSAVAKREKELAGATAPETARNGLQSTNRGQLRGSSNVSGWSAGQGINVATNAHRPQRLVPDVIDASVSKDTSGIDSSDQAMDDIDELPEPLFFPKYLTGRKLFEYEIRDVSFRRHVLVQFLVLFQYLLSFTPATRRLQGEWKNTFVRSKFLLDGADENWIRSAFRAIMELIKDIQPDGASFAEAVRVVLKREVNWIRWKEDMCPTFENPPLSPQQLSEFAAARAKLSKEPTEFPHRLGTAALSELWEGGLPPPVAGTRTGEDELGNETTIPTDGLEELEIPPPIPSLEHYNKSIQRENTKINLRKKQLGTDADGQDETIQAAIERTQSMSWRALRIARQDNLHLFDTLKQPDDIDELLKAMDKERKSLADAKTMSEESMS